MLPGPSFASLGFMSTLWMGLDTTMSNGAELSSLATALEELSRRVTSMADGYAAERREDLAGELYTVERQLANVVRRISRVVDADT